MKPWRSTQPTTALCAGLVIPALFLHGCGGGGGSNAPMQPVTVRVSSSGANVLLGNTQQLKATVTGTSNTGVTWTVNGIPGGNAALGTISSTGLYTAPQDLPNPASVTIKATSQADSTKSGKVALTIASDIRLSVATNPPGMSSVNPSGMVQLLATVASAGHPDTHVNWAVNGVANGNSTLGTISATGPATAWYTAPATAPNTASVTITAVCAADPSRSGQLVQAVQACQLNGTIGYVAPAPYVAPSGATCDVSDVPTLQSCVAAVRSGAATKVRFTAMVNCSGNQTCLVDLENVNGPITFFGAAGITAGFRRTDTYTYSLVKLNGASAIAFANLTLDEGPPDPACTPYLVNGVTVIPCQPTVYVSNSSGILFEQVTVLHSKQNGIAFTGTQGVTIRDSTVQDAGVFGIWTDGSSSAMSSNVSLVNNLIQDSLSNGIFLSFTQNATIGGNTLKHNQYVALFQTCGGGCAGGQIDMLNNTSLQIYSNEIVDGQIDLNNATGQTWGIEIANPNVDVLITNNQFTNNVGAGIGADGGASGTNFVITGNQFSNNGTNLFGLSGTGIQESGDCLAP